MMISKRALAAALLGFGLVACGDTGAPTAETPAATEAEKASLEVASTEKLEMLRSQFARIEMTPDTSFLTDEERQVVNLLNEAGNLMSAIYLRQLSEKNPGWREAIAGSDIEDKELVLDLFDLHFGPWDTLDHNEPFVGDAERPVGAGFYPADITKDEFEAWIAENPGDEEAFRSGYTVIRRTGDGGLKAIPYSEHYAEFLIPAAELMRQAAEITTNESLKRFLTLRADSFLSDDYFESEMAWMDLDGPIEVAIGPYEVYDDELYGVKTAFEAFITVKNPEESAALDKYKGMLRDMEENLPVADSYKNFQRGFESPIAVVDQVHGGGDNVPGVQTIAFNLPNDERVREAKGAKKVLLNNVMGAKFDRILAPMASKMLVDQQADLLMQEYMGVNTLFHELSHSLGPGTIVVDGETTTVNAQLQERYSPMEEGKADVMGAYNILYMMDLGELPAAEKENFLATYFAGLFRSMRFGIGEAHGKGAAFQYSYYMEVGAATVDPESGKYDVDFAKLAEAIRDLTAKVVMLQGDGDYDAAGDFLDGYGKLDADAERIIASMTDIPVDIQPVYADAL
ncbi:hypothetical protein HK107_15345 [Parvularcula sp. ZS-1/3]|uniref:Peptidase family M49 n=1 Tax=Parvularcula mediterranea TaxID=2732508 RepID=A0A7Y3W6W6_9PROT|nr:hypothetical protein [Parvularcula mediterranea]NNU17706.1 hypothetical protein [Parvularcula mediterranea]